MAQHAWAILTGEYPPMPGGVSDHTLLLAEALAAMGDEVHVFVPRQCETQPGNPGVYVRRLPDHYGASGLTCLSQWIEQLPSATRIFIQYTPQAFGYAGMNLLFCEWLRMTSRSRSVDVLFHEVRYPIEAGQALRDRALGRVTEWMAQRVAQAAQRVFVSTAAWEPIVRAMVPEHVPIIVTPAPSNLPMHASPADVAAARVRITRGRVESRVVGHFGTHGRWARETVGRVFRHLLGAPNVCAALIGRGSEACAAGLARCLPQFAGRIFATGALPPVAAAAHLSACDLLAQPFIDGITTRRSSAMAGLALGIATVTTDGVLTESIWRHSRAVALAPAGDTEALIAAVQRVLGDGDHRRCLARRGALLYRAQFHLGHTIRALRGSLSPSR